MNNELRPQLEINSVFPHESSADASKADTCAATDNLFGLLGQNSDRDLLLILMGQMLETRTELRVLQATVNTLLIELCNRQPDKLSRSLARISAQRRQELLSHLRTESAVSDQRTRVEPNLQLPNMPIPAQSKELDLLETAQNGLAHVDHAETRQVSHS